MSTENHVTADLDAFVHEVLSPERAAEVAAHCEACTACGKELAAAQSRKDQLLSLPPVEASEELIQKTVSSIDQKETRRANRWKRFGLVVMVTAIAASLMIGVFHGYYATLAPLPIDLRLLGQRELLSDGRANFRVRAVHAITGEPIANAPVSVSMRNEATGENITLASFQTNDQGEGVAEFITPAWQGSFPLTVSADSSIGSDELTETITLKREWKLMLSTDKPVYKPGQPIQMRSISLRRPDLKPVTGQNITYRVTDPKGNLIFKQTDVSSEFGITSATCPLASEILLGDYEIQIESGETTSVQTVTVERYVLPKLKVAVSLDKPFYTPGAKASGTIQADYFFGKPVAGGTVEIEIRGSEFERFEPITIEQTTDADGACEFEFAVPNRLTGRPQDGGNARISVAAVVTDTAGQKYSSSASRLVVAEPILLDIIPESPQLVRGQPNRIYIFARYPHGRPAEVNLLVSGQEEKLRTNNLGVASFELVPEKNRETLIVKATDDDSLTGRKSLSLGVGAVEYDFVVRADQAIYRSGDTMKLLALGSGVQPVFVDLIQEGQAVISQTVSMTSGKGVAEIDLPADLFGTLKLVTHRFGSDGLAVRKSQLIHVEKAKEVQIAAEFDAAEYRPGENAKLKIRLTDQDGKPAPGAVSLAAVDEAVFAVLGGAQGMEQTFFLLEQELLEPVYAIYDSWSPGGGRGIPEDDRLVFHQALFANAARVSTQTSDASTQFIAKPDFARFEDLTNSGAGSPMGFEAEMIDAPMMEMEAAPVADGGFNPVAFAGESPYTLYGATYQAKMEEMVDQRSQGLQGAYIAWGLLAAGLFVTALGAFAVYAPRVFIVLSVLFGTVAVCLVTMFSPILFYASNSAFDAVGMEMPEAMVAEMDAGGANWGMMDGAEEMEMVLAAPMDDATMMTGEDDDAAGPAPPRMRTWFPETLLWKPQLVTGDNGVAELEIPLADSITSWRMSASAVTGSGSLGSARFPIRVFQPFFVDLDLPVALTRNDSVGLRAVVSNYLNEPQTVELTLADGDWYELIATEPAAETAEPEIDPMSEEPPFPAANEDAVAETKPAAPRKFTVELKAGEVKAVTFPIRVRTVGSHTLELTALAGKVSDAIRREIEVLPGGQRIENVASGSIEGNIEVAINTPADAIEGSSKAILKIHPSSFSQLVEGLDSIFQMPYGCFEQTSSTTYPNILALEYLRKNKLNKPEIEAKALQYIQVGYQRLISFEVNGGGFDWFGNPPANQTLTAYGLMEFEDMARVHDVDQALIDRTRQWLLARREPNGSWKAEPNMLNDGLASSVLQGGDLDLGVTAYIAWAVFGSGNAQSAAAPTLTWLTNHSPSEIKDPYTLAIMGQAIAGIDKDHASLKAILDRLEELQKVSEDGKQVWWEQPKGESTMFYGNGQAGSVETTALVALTLMRGGRGAATTKKALTWIVEQKGPNGLWYSTQATVLALRALIEGSDAPLGDDVTRTIHVAVDGQPAKSIVIPPDQADVMQQIDLSQFVSSAGEHQVTLRDDANSGSAYHLAFWHHIDVIADQSDAALTVDIAYDRQRINVNDTITATAVVTNTREVAAPMVILDLPIPGGFVIEPGELDELKGSGLIAKYQITPRKAIVYLTGIRPNDSLKLQYRLRATMPVEVTAPAGEAYEYYNPAHRGESKPAKLEAVEA